MKRYKIKKYFKIIKIKLFSFHISISHHSLLFLYSLLPQYPEKESRNIVASLRDLIS